MAEVVKKKKKARAGHKSYLKKTLAETKICIEDFSEEKRARADQLRATLQEQLEAVRKLDDEILEILTGIDEVEDAEIEQEIETAGEFRGEVKVAIRNLNELNTKPTGGVQTESQPHATVNTRQQAKVVRAKLPKLEVRGFGG